MAVEWSITVGNLLTSALTLIGFIFGGIGAYYAVKNQLSQLAGLLATFGGRMINMENELKKLNDVLMAIAVQDERILSLTKRQDDQQQEMNALRVRADQLMERINSGRPK